MAAIYRIAELSTVKDTGALYALVHFFASEADAVAGSPILLTNDFLMPALVDERERIALDAQGRWRLTDGRALTEAQIQALPRAERAVLTFVREVRKEPVAAQIAENIERYWQRAEVKKWTGDHTGDAAKPLYEDGKPVAQAQQVVVRDASDPKGLHARADVVALKEARKLTERVR